NYKAIITNKKLLEIDKLAGMKAMFCYQLISRNTSKAFWVPKVLNDLALEFNAKIERRSFTKECIVISRNKSAKAITSTVDSGKQQDFQTFVRLLNFSVRWKLDQPLFIDESGLSGTVMMPSYRHQQFNLNQLNQALEP